MRGFAMVPVTVFMLLLSANVAIGAEETTTTTTTKTAAGEDEQQQQHQEGTTDAKTGEETLTNSRANSGKRPTKWHNQLPTVVSHPDHMHMAVPDTT